MIDFLPLMQEFFPSFDSNSSFEGRFSRIGMCGGIRKRGHSLLCIYAPFYTKKCECYVRRVRKPMGSQKQTMKTSRGYASPAGENSLRGVRYSLDRFLFTYFKNYYYAQ